jgi:anaerobic ribonucleoside-triphosphate reductase activating protein
MRASNKRLNRELNTRGLNMRYANLITEDLVNGEGVCVSLFMQGCHFHCPGCHNPETWDFNGGKEIDVDDLLANIVEAISKNKIIRNFSILGGEPLAPENIKDTMTIIYAIRLTFPEIKIFLWTGYEANELPNSKTAQIIYDCVDEMIVGRFKMEERDITLPLRGSRNQEVLTKKKIFDIINIENEKEKNNG